jgi:hypothetical protein
MTWPKSVDPVLVRGMPADWSPPDLDDPFDQWKAQMEAVKAAGAWCRITESRMVQIPRRWTHDVGWELGTFEFYSDGSHTYARAIPEEEDSSDG